MPVETIHHYQLHSGRQGRPEELQGRIDAGHLAVVIPLFGEEEQHARLINESSKPLPELEDKEIDALALLAQGYKNKDIAAKWHMQRGLSMKSILDKYDVDTTTQAVITAIQQRALRPSMFVNDFDFSSFERMDDVEKDVLRELTNIEEPNDSKSIGERIGGLSAQDVNNKLSRMYRKYDLRNQQRAAALYMVAEHPEWLEDEDTHFPVQPRK